jgi:spore coat polysaccharide biosynthesis protein SpsF
MSGRAAITVLVQSRLASSRLPAKALLPVAGHPAVVLCALRAANTGHNVIVATSENTPDDAIAQVLASAGVSCFRGDHDDVLKRFTQATRDHLDDDVVVRLTADNLFPDGAFVSALLSEFERSPIEYLGVTSPQSGLPYGLNAEVFTVAALRRADHSARTPFDREHVTPWIKRAGSARRYTQPGFPLHWPRLRCTLDTFEDYEVLLRVFDGIRDAVHIGWQELVARLADQSIGGLEPRSPYRELPDGSVHSVLTLGTAQLGSNYGIANRVGMPGETEILRMLAVAADAGITAVDTASAYGESERQLGRLLPPNFADRIRITTKLDPLADLPPDAPRKLVADAVDASVFKSLYRLKRVKLDSLLLHRWTHHDAWGGAAWARLIELKRSGLIGTLGASVSYPSEAIEALSDPEIGQLQCPVNLLDGRWRDSAFLAKLALRSDLIVHGRSVLLQGMLTLPAEEWIQVPGVDPRQLCANLDEIVVGLGRINRIDLAIAYVAALPWVTSLVVGAESLDQLRSNLRYAQAPKLTVPQLRLVEAAIPRLPDAFLNPALWKHSTA